MMNNGIIQTYTLILGALFTLNYNLHYVAHHDHFSKAIDITEVKRVFHPTILVCVRNICALLVLQC